jgi:ferritin-like metal-binding protein YciE
MLDTLNGLLQDQIKDLFNAESQLVKALPKMAKASTEPELKQAFQSHLQETQTHVERLRQIADTLGCNPKGKTCKAMQGLVKEGGEVLEEDGEAPVIDAALIAAAQRVEHYEISAYGTARAIAEQLGQDKVVKLLQATLDEERAADQKLTGISQKSVLTAAMACGSENGEEH